MESSTTRINNAMRKYPDRIPVVIKKKETDHSLPELTNNKYLIPRSFTMAEFMSLLRKKIKIEPSKAIFIFVDNVLVPNIFTMDELYHSYKDPKDGFLYITYCIENTFG